MKSFSYSWDGKAMSRHSDFASVMTSLGCQLDTLKCVNPSWRVAPTGLAYRHVCRAFSWLLINGWAPISGQAVLGSIWNGTGCESWSKSAVWFFQGYCSSFCLQVPALSSSFSFLRGYIIAYKLNKPFLCKLLLDMASNTAIESKLREVARKTRCEKCVNHIWSS